MEGHTACIINSLLILFGGKNEIKSRPSELYSNTLRVVHGVSRLLHGECNSTLIRVMPAKPTPLGRAYHTACAHRGRFMVVFGGMVEKSQEQDRSMCLIDILDVDLWCWYRTDAKGDQPCSRFHHASTIHGESIFIHGGYPLALDGKGSMKDFTSDDILFGMGNSLFDTFALNLETMIWRRITLETSSRPMLWGHSAISFRENILLFGGVDVSKHTEVGDIVLWNVRRQAWQWAGCPCPIASAMHRAVVVSGESDNTEKPLHMLVFGGIQFSTQERISVIREFDLQEGSWCIVHSTGEVPASRIGHSVLSYDNSTVLVIGGLISAPGEPVQDTCFYIYYVQTRNWKKINLLEDKEPFSYGTTIPLHRPYMGKNCVAVWPDMDGLESDKQVVRNYERTNEDGCSVVPFQAELIFLRKENEILRRRLQNCKPDGNHENVVQQENFVGDIYDTPPPLPRNTHATSSCCYFKHGLFHSQSQGQDYNAPNGSKSEGSLKLSPFIAAEGSVSHHDDVHSLEGLGPLMNVSNFLINEAETPLIDSRPPSDMDLVSHFSPHLIQKMIDLTLGQGFSDVLPDHIANTKPSDDPFSYLQPTKAVMSWRK